MTGMKRLLVLACLLTLAMAYPAVGAAAQERAVPEARAEITLSFAPLVRDVAPAVVNIYTRRVVTARPLSPLLNDPFFRRFFPRELLRGQPRRRQEAALGSGVIVEADGLVVTNHHVIDRAEEITVVLADRREFEAEVILSDDSTDLAVLRLSGVEESLPVVPLADSDALQVGDLVLAIGNPFGVGQTVTSGIVSAQARTTAGITDYNFFIQTDAAINPGNSGGALVDMQGRLVGINTAIYSRSGGSLGIGFAIPANMVRSVLDSIERGIPLQRPWLGADGQNVTADIAESLALDRPRGVLVNLVEPDSPAEAAGLRVGDIVLAVNGREVAGIDALRFRVATLTIGTPARLTVWRDGGTADLTLDVIAPPEDPPRNITPLAGRHPFAGAVVANLSPALIAELEYRGSLRRGVVVLEVDRRAPAGRLGLRPGDVIREVNGIAIPDVATLRQVLGRGARSWHLTVRRGQRDLETHVRG
jgi:serine protease Do